MRPVKTFFATLTIGCIAFAAVAQAKTMTVDNFIKNAAIANKFEIDSSKLALDKTENTDVRQFAQMMIDDHTKGLEETKKVAAAKNVTLPSEPDMAHQKLAAELKAVPADKFDLAYAKRAGVADHLNVHASLKKDISMLKDADVKALATKLEPTVAHHVEMAKKLATAVK